MDGWVEGWVDGPMDSIIDRCHERYNETDCCSQLSCGERWPDGRETLQAGKLLPVFP
jgi:hypothetical protein